MKKTKSFKFWTSEDVEKTFGIKRVRNSKLLLDWINANENDLSDEKKVFLKNLQENLIEEIEYWNEEELKFHFMGKFVDLIKFEQFERYRSFLGRTLTAEVDGMILSGEVDFMVATGKHTPYYPFFFLHEYKQELKRDNDPLGQLLIAMVAAKAKNNNKKPIYGCYVTGRFWFFVALHEKEYSVSNAYNATDNDIIKIAAIIQKAKDYIERDLAELGI